MEEARKTSSKKETVIQVRGLVTGFGSKVIHDHLDLDVYRGEVMGIVGGSGSGKSVLLQTVIGLNRAREGTIEVFGEPIDYAEGAKMRVLEMRWGVLFQEGALFSSMTVAENIQVPLREYTGMEQGLMDEIASMKIAMVGLPEDTAQKYPSELSGGMKKRAGLARADDETREARSNDVTRRDAAFASGAQVVVTDFALSDPAIGPYRVSLADQREARCGTMLGSENCVRILDAPLAVMASLP